MAPRAAAPHRGEPLARHSETSASIDPIENTNMIDPPALPAGRFMRDMMKKQCFADFRENLVNAARP